MTGIAATPSKDSQSRWQVAWEFAIQAVVGILIFVVIALAAVAIELVVQAVEYTHLSRIVVYGLRLGEYAIFCADLLTFLVFIWHTTTRTLKALNENEKHFPR